MGLLLNREHGPRLAHCVHCCMVLYYVIADVYFSNSKLTLNLCRYCLDSAKGAGLQQKPCFANAKLQKTCPTKRKPKTALANRDWRDCVIFLNACLYRDLVPVTQLYVSVDASTREGLKKIDRPLFRDFWERFVASLQALSDKVDNLVEFA